MPTELGFKFNPISSIYPPGLSREDHYLYSLWRQKHAAKAITFYFNVRLGDGRDPGEGCDEEGKRWWYLCTAKRADLIALFNDYVEIVEFRFNASANAIGRLLCYKNCWMHDPQIDLPLKLRLVTNNYDYDVELLSKQTNIIYEVLP